MNASSVKCPLCSKTYDKILLGFLYHCGGCDFSWDVETKDNLKPATEAESGEFVWKDSKTKLFNNGLDQLERLLPSRGKLLDIGAGFGYFLDLARNRGWQVSGIDIDRKAIDFSKKRYGLEIFDKPIVQLGIPDNMYDAVTLWIVIEQLPDPVAELAQVFRILKPGGIVYIRAYNHSFHRLTLPLSRILSGILKMSASMIHSYNFTAKSLMKIIQDRGFVDIHIINSPASQGDPYSTGGIFGARCVAAAKFGVYTFSRLLAGVSFGNLLLSSTMTAYGRKPK